MFSTKFTEWAILELLIQHESLNTHQVYELLKKEYNVELSLAQLYKIIKQMYQAYMVVKDGVNIKLNMRRINKMHMYSDQLKKKSSSQKQVMREGEHKFFEVNNLHDVDSPWAHIVNQIYNEKQHEDLYFYDSHPYYFIYDHYFPIRLYHPFYSETYKVYQLVWHKTYLDVYWISINGEDNIIISYEDLNELPKSGYLCEVIGDYIIEFHLPPIMAWALDRFYDSVKSIDEFDLQEYAKIFSLKVDCKFLVRRNKKDAKALASTIKSYFSQREN